MSDNERDDRPAAGLQAAPLAGAADAADAEAECPFGNPHLFPGRVPRDDGTTDVPLPEERPWQGSGGRRRSGRR